jgi:hypothetical protein
MFAAFRDSSLSWKRRFGLRSCKLHGSGPEFRADYGQQEVIQFDEKRARRRSGRAGRLNEGATRDSSRIVRKPEVIQVGPIGNDKSASVDLSKLLGSVGDVTDCPDKCTLAGQVALREM